MRHGSIGLDHELRRKAWSMIAFESKNKAGRTVIPAMVGQRHCCKMVHFRIHCRQIWKRNRLYTNEDRNSSLTVPMMTCRAESLERGGRSSPLPAMVGGDFDSLLKARSTFPLRVCRYRAIYLTPIPLSYPARWRCASLVHWALPIRETTTTAIIS
jgi:hypothetical protein